MSADVATRALEALRRHFGHEDFQGPQLEIIRHVLAGEDALVIMPTGGGKSLCYQLPAMLSDGMTVVLSPLIALMQDQVDALRRRGIPAAFVNSSLDRAERHAVMQQALNGQVKLLYVTPERFKKPEFLDVIDRISVDLLAVDEAHCISSWGHDFRPEYGRVGVIRRRLGEPPTIALTATATPETARDIVDRLGIEGARTFHTGIDRPNLHVAIREVNDADERLDRVVEVVQALGGPGIIYHALIRDLHELEDCLRRRGLEPLVYHGKLSPDERRSMQRRFLESSSAVVLATNAFGMGVDKPDIRFILHLQIPGSIEAWYQEIGRAGRDGAPAICELLYLEEDLMIQKDFIEWSNPSPAFLRSVYDLMESWGENLYARDVDDVRETLLLKNRRDGRPDVALSLLRAEGVIQGTFEQGDLEIARPLEPGEEERLVDPEKRRRDLQRLLRMVELARSEECRRFLIADYFGLERPAASCGNCDRCTGTASWLDAHRSTPREALSSTASESDDHRIEGAPVERGDWIRIGRRHHVVRRVERRGSSWVIEAESADDLETRTFDLGRTRWRRIE